MSMAGHQGFALRLACFYGATFLVSGAKVTYLPVWLDWRGLTASEISIVAAAPLFIRIVLTPLIAFAADRTGDHRGALIVQAWLSLLFLSLLATASGFWAILALTLALSIATTTMMPLSETIAMSGVRKIGLDYGRMRLWGSITFIVASFAAGIGVDRLGIGSVILMLIAGAAITVAAAHVLPPPFADEAPAGQRRLSPGDVARLLLTGRFALFLAAVAAIQSAHAMFYTFGVLHWRAQGHSAVTASLLWAVGVTAEIGLFAFSGPIVRRLGASVLILTAAAAAVVRWLAMAADPPLAGLVALQALHGLTYGAAHLGAVHMMTALVPPAQAGTAQAIYASATHGIALGLAMLLSGRLYPEYGGRAYLAMAALSFAGLAASALLLRTPKAA